LARHPISASIEIKIETTWGSREERFNSHLKTPSSYPLDAKANLLQRHRLLPVQNAKMRTHRKRERPTGKNPATRERERDKDPEKKHHPAHTRTRYKRRHRGRRRRKALSLSFTTYIIG
jgi:hypothetical protein